MSLVIRGGLVYAPGGMVAADVLVRGGRVDRVGVGIELEESFVVDASGCVVGPGFVDLHTHLRDPGQTWKEDLASGVRSAAAGGFTGLVVMPNTEPAIDGPATVAELRRRADAVGVAEVAVAGALTTSRAGVEPADLESMYAAGVRLFTDDGDCVEDDALVELVMRRVGRLPGAVLAQHAEQTSLSGAGHMHQGASSRALGMGGIPTEAETAIVARDLELVRRTGVSYHCQHVSSAATVELIARAKTDGLDVTAEVTPHHLTFTDSDVADLGPNLKMYPPVRTAADRSALRSALVDGIIDAVATDHAPHTAREKSVGFAEAPRGVIGLETAASVVWDVVGDPHRFFGSLSARPAEIAGMGSQGRPIEPGAHANLVVFDPRARWVVEGFFSKSENSPYLGREMTGRVVATIHEGELVHGLERGRL